MARECRNKGKKQRGIEKKKWNPEKLGKNSWGGLVKTQSK